MDKERIKKLRRAKEHWRYVAQYLGNAPRGHRPCGYDAVHPRKCALHHTGGFGCAECPIVPLCGYPEIVEVLGDGKHMNSPVRVKRARQIAERTFRILRRAHKQLLVDGRINRHDLVMFHALHEAGRAEPYRMA